MGLDIVSKEGRNLITTNSTISDANGQSLNRKDITATVNVNKYEAVPIMKA